MSLVLEIMIIVALLVFVVTGLVSMGLTIWYIKQFGPMFKQMMKYTNKMYEEEYGEED